MLRRPRVRPISNITTLSEVAFPGLKLLTDTLSCSQGTKEILQLGNLKDSRTECLMRQWHPRAGTFK